MVKGANVEPAYLQFGVRDGAGRTITPNAQRPTRMPWPVASRCRRTSTATLASVPDTDTDTDKEKAKDIVRTLGPLIAVNDKAISDLVAYLSHSPIWPKTVVFLMEDDSQDGLDHVATATCSWSPPRPQPRASSPRCTSVRVSVLRAIELVLGTDRISAYTQFAPVPYRLFTSKPDLTPYTAITPTYPLSAVNPKPTPGTAASVPLDLSHFDVAGPVLDVAAGLGGGPGRRPERLIRTCARRERGDG